MQQFVRTYFDDIESLWNFIYSKSKKNARKECLKAFQCNELALIAVGDDLLQKHVSRLERKIKPEYTDIKKRLDVLRVTDTSSIHFLNEILSISDAIDDYNEIDGITGSRRARRYRIQRRINELLEEERVYNRTIGYIWNKLEKRDDRQLHDTIDSVTMKVRNEFDL